MNTTLAREHGVSSRPLRFAPIRSARHAMPPLQRLRVLPMPSIVAAPPATPGPGITPPAPPPPEHMPPEIQEPPSPAESPVPVREPPVMPPPMGLTLRLLRPDVPRMTR
jgi:hypothetical protein